MLNVLASIHGALKPVRKRSLSVPRISVRTTISRDALAAGTIKAMRPNQVVE